MAISTVAKVAHMKAFFDRLWRHTETDLAAAYDQLDTILAEQIVDDMASYRWSFTVANKTGGTLTKGTLVYLSGYDATLGCPSVTKADADTAGKPAEFVLTANIANDASGTVYTVGTVTSIDTSGASAVGALAYLSTDAGAFTWTAPSGADQIVQVVGVCVTKHASTGSAVFFPGLKTITKYGTSGLQDDAISLAKLAAITRGSIIVGGEDNAPTDLDAKTAGQILVGDGTDIKSVAVSGDATLAATGTLTLANTGAGEIMVGDGEAVGAVTLSGDASMLSTGAVTVSSVEGVDVNAILEQMAEAAVGGMEVKLSSDTEYLSAADLNLAPASSVTVDVDIKIVDSSDAVHAWFNGKTAGLTPAEDCNDEHIAAPTLGAGEDEPEFVAGEVTVTLTMDTDEGATKTYQDADEVSVTAAHLADHTVFGWEATYDAGDTVTITIVGIPTVSGCAPATGDVAGGTEVVITGTRFIDVTSVTFGGTEATSFEVDSPTQITAISPAHAQGVVDVIVTALGGVSVDEDDFEYTSE